MADEATRSARLRVLLVILVALSAFAAFLWLRGRGPRSNKDTIDFTQSSRLENPSATPAISSSPASSLVPSAETSATPVTSPAPIESPSVENTQSAIDLTPDGSYLGTLKLIIPVVGVRPDQLLDTFTDARSEGRVHDAIDIPAAAGTAVVAAADGEIIKLFQSERGGTTIYQLSTNRRLVFYYAHLQRYAEGLAAGKFAKQGEVIAYVGDTGNAGAGNYHLHFSISIVADPKRYWEGTNINPYPLLHK